MGIFNFGKAPWQRSKTEPGAVANVPDTDEKRADDYFAGMTPYEKEREEARFRVIADSMEQALGRGKGSRNPPVQECDYSPFRW